MFKKGVVAFLLSAGLALPTGTGYDELKTAYLTGWFDAFRINFYMKNVKKVRVPTGWWVVYPLKELPLEYVAFYIFGGLREGVKPVITNEYIVFGTFGRRADAEFLAKRLRLKDIDAVVMWHEATDGQQGISLRTVYVEPRFGIEGVLYHLNKAIEKAQDIDPSVLNRDLLLKDLRAIQRELNRWKAGRKGYKKVIEEQEHKRFRSHSRSLQGEKSKKRVIEDFIKGD